MIDDITVDEGQEDLMVARAYLYKLFWLLFGREPEQGTLDSLSSETAALSLGLYRKTDGSGDAADEASLCDLIEHAKTKSVEDLRWEYTRLFIGPATPTAPPWESVYSSSDGLIKQKCMLEVRDAYAAMGYAPANRPQTLDDSLSLELDFLFRLADRARVGDGQEQADALIASLEFINNHLLVWLPPFVDKLSGSKSDFYYCAGRLLRDFVENDRYVLDRFTQTCTTSVMK